MLFFPAARHLSRGTGEGLYESLERAIQYVDINDWKTKVMGFVCDGASTNIAEDGLKRHCYGIVMREIPWIFMFWCLAHRLELSVKDALQSTFFSTTDVLLHLYYLYKVPSIGVKSCLEPSEIPTSKGASHVCVHVITFHVVL